MVRTPSHRKPTHPGEMLLEEFLVPMGLTQRQLEDGIHVPYQRINEIINGRRGMTPSTALRLARYFGMSERFWLNLQAQHDIETTKRKLGMGLEDQVQPRPNYFGPELTIHGNKFYVQMEDGKRVRVTLRTKREYGAALMERINQYFVAQGSSLSEFREKAVLESLRGRPLGLYVVVKEGGKPVRVTPRAIRKYGRALVEPINRLFEAQGTTFLEFLEKLRASKGPKDRGPGG